MHDGAASFAFPIEKQCKLCCIHYVCSMARSYKRGDRVQIVAGKYKEHGEGEFLKWSGAWSASVKVKGDTRPSRTLRLTSLRRWPVSERRSSTSEASNSIGTGGKEEILADIDALVKTLKAMELKVKELM